MNKKVLSLIALSLAGCSTYHNSDCGCEQNVTYSEPAWVEVDPCKCTYAPAKAEVLRPRIKLTIVENKVRNCPSDTQMLNCGCGYCDTFAQQEKSDVNTYEIVPAMPEAYELAASRVFNKFIKDTTQIYGAKPNVLLYLEPAEVLSEDLPDGVKQGVKTFKNKILSSFTYAVTDDDKNNDYLLQTEVDWFDTPSKTVPAIKYMITLFDKENNKIGQWVEVVKKAENSQKWL